MPLAAFRVGLEVGPGFGDDMASRFPGRAAAVAGLTSCAEAFFFLQHELFVIDGDDDFTFGLADLSGALAVTARSVGLNRWELDAGAASAN